MSTKKKIRIFQRSLARYGLYAFNWFFSYMPYGVVRFTTKILIFIGFQFTIRQKRSAKESLQIAFGKEKNEKEIDEIIKKCFVGFGYDMAEMLYFLSHPKMVKEKVIIKGREYLDEALKKGKGVIAVTAHLGNFPLLMLKLANEGYNASAIIRQTRDPELTEYLHKRRDQVGLKTIYALPRQECVNNTIKTLRENGVVFIPVDQNFGDDGGVYVDFFGQKAATATGPIVFATRTKAVILPMFIIRDHDDVHTVIIEKPHTVEERSNDKETVVVNMAKITKLVEKYVREYPHEWAWMHRRWKSQPLPHRKNLVEIYEKNVK